MLKTEDINKRCLILEKYTSLAHSEHIWQYLQKGMTIHSKVSFSIVIKNFPYVFYRPVLDKSLISLYFQKSYLSILCPTVEFVSFLSGLHPAGHTASDTSQDAIGLLNLLGTRWLTFSICQTAPPGGWALGILPATPPPACSAAGGCYDPNTGPSTLSC